MTSSRRFARSIAGRRGNEPLLQRWRHRQAKATETSPPRWERVSRGPWLNAAELTRPWALIIDAGRVAGRCGALCVKALQHCQDAEVGLPIRLAASLARYIERGD